MTLLLACVSLTSAFVGKAINGSWLKKNGLFGPNRETPLGKFTIKSIGKEHGT